MQDRIIRKLQLINLWKCDKDQIFGPTVTKQNKQKSLREEQVWGMLATQFKNFCLPVCYLKMQRLKYQLL
jgi:hypothetical protein